MNIMNAKTQTSVKEKESLKATKETKKVIVSPEFVVHQLNEDVRNSILIVSVLANVFFLIGWLVIQVSSRYDAALINYLQNK
jgi:hypothetical protein